MDVGFLVNGFLGWRLKAMTAAAATASGSNES